MANYFGIGYQFLNLTREAINEMIKQGNHTLIISGATPKGEDPWKKYEESTTWNDFNVGVPILFNFYHGLELLLKALVFELGLELKKTNHDLNYLLDLIKKLNNPDLNNIINVFELHLSNKSPFSAFFKQNGGTPNSYYEMLKYPESRKKQNFIFSEIRGNETEGLKRFEIIRNSTIEIREAIIEWNTKRFNNANT